MNGNRRGSSFWEITMESWDVDRKARMKEVSGKGEKGGEGGICSEWVGLREGSI